MAFALVIPSLARVIEPAGGGSWPAVEQFLALEIGLKAFMIERPLAGGVAHIDAILCVHDWHHRITHRTPSTLVGKLRENLHIDGRATLVDQCQAADELAAVE